MQRECAAAASRERAAAQAPGAGARGRGAARNRCAPRTSSPSAQVQTKAEDVLGVKAQLQALERQRRRSGARSHARGAAPRAAAARARAARARSSATSLLAQQAAENEAQQRIVVRAPQDGIVTAVLAEPGQSVAPTRRAGQPDAGRCAAAGPAVSRRRARSASCGRSRRCCCATRPSRTRSSATSAAMCVQVSRAPLQPSELAGLPLPAVSGAALARTASRSTASPSRSTRSRCRPTGRRSRWPPGMQLDADVLLDRRRLIEWIFEPLLERRRARLAPAR